MKITEILTEEQSGFCMHSVGMSLQLLASKKKQS